MALEYAGQCLSKGSKVTLTVESATALRNLHDAPADDSRRRDQLSAKSADAWHQKSIIECSFRLSKVLYPH